MEEPDDVSIATRYRIELVREYSKSYDNAPACSSPDLVAKFLSELVRPFVYEVMGAVMLDTRHRAIGHLIAYRGTLSRAAVEPRGLLVPALLGNAAGIILFHNHPSGDTRPSAEDCAFTRRLKDAGEIVGVDLVDHLVLAGDEDTWMSFRERGIL